MHIRTRRRVLRTLVCLLLLGCVPRSSAEESAAPALNVLLVSIDTLRADHLGCYGYFRDTSPVIDALAAVSTVFESALTPLGTTLPAHTSLLTGTHPIEHGVLANLTSEKQHWARTKSIRSFAEFARERGYRTAAFVSGAPLSRTTGIAAGFEVYDEPGGSERIAETTNRALFEWLDRKGREPFFVFLHYFDPHSPFAAPAPYATMFDDGPELAAHIAARKMAESVVRPNGNLIETQASINGYDGEIRYADAQLGQVFARLRAAGLWDRTLTVVLSDHGEGLGEHGMAGHGYLHREQIHVPLILHVPGAPPGRVTFPVSLVDVLPTVIGRLGEGGLPAWQSFLEQASGRDLLATGTEAEPVLTRRVARKRPDLPDTALSLAVPGWKFVFEPDAGDQLFDWTADPLELKSVAARELSRVESMRRALVALVKRYESRRDELNGDSAPGQQEIDPQLLEKLRALGYTD